MPREIRILSLSAVPTHVEDKKASLKFDDCLLDALLRSFRRFGFTDTATVKQARHNLQVFIREHVDPEIQRILAEQNFRKDKSSLYQLPAHREFKKPGAYQFLAAPAFDEAGLEDLIYEICDSVYVDKEDIAFKAVCVRHCLEVRCWLRCEDLVN